MYPSLKVLKPVKLAKSLFRKLYDVNRESAKVLAEDFLQNLRFAKFS